MKQITGLALALLFVLALPARAQSPDNQYVGIYELIQAGDAFAASGQAEPARAKYLEAQAALQRLQKLYPDYSPRVVNFRLNYLAEKIGVAPASATASPTTAAPPAGAPATKPVSAKPPAPAPSVAAEAERQVAELREQIQSLQSDKATLQAKLKEALATQPAAVDPRELARADQTIQSLSKENELLKASLSQQSAKTASTGNAKALAESKAALSEANRKLGEQTELAKNLSQGKESLQSRIDSLLAENKALQTRLANASNAQDRSAELVAARKSLEDSNHKLTEQTELARKLSADKASLQARVERLTSSAGDAEALRLENELLKKQLTGAKSVSRGDGDAALKLAEAQTHIAALQSDAELLRLEKIALQNRIRTMTNAGGRPMVQVVTNDLVRVVTNSVVRFFTNNAVQVVTNSIVKVVTNVVQVASRTADEGRIKKLEAERDALQKQLASANAALVKRGGVALAAKVDELNNQITALRARIEVFEARAVPYTAEELALFKSPPAKLAGRDPKAGKKSVKDLPAGTVALAAEAQRAFANHEFDRAEEKYLQILRQDEKNSYTLANLAAIQLEEGKLPDAEKSVVKALATAPDDAYALSILGFLRFRQEKYDEALEALSKAARLDPENAEIQNYLGVTLSHKGLRGPAETALRKAITIDPGYGSAHNNLAVIYLSQSPPSVALARWHYEKALAAGHPKNPDLEKMLEQKAGLENAQ